MVAAGGIQESMLGVKDSRSIGFRPIGLLKMSSLDNCNHFLSFPWCNAKESLFVFALYNIYFHF